MKKNKDDPNRAFGTAVTGHAIRAGCLDNNNLCGTTPRSGRGQAPDQVEGKLLGRVFKSKEIRHGLKAVAHTVESVHWIEA